METRESGLVMSLCKNGVFRKQRGGNDFYKSMVGMTWPLNPRLLLALALLVAWPWSLWTALNRGETAGRASVQQKWDAATTLRARETLKLVERAHATSQALQDKAAEQRKATNDQTTRINRAHALAIERLRDRPERPADTGVGSLSEAATVGEHATGCTGAGLFRSDSVFLSGLAADADKLRAGLQACQTQYNAARETLK